MAAIAAGRRAKGRCPNRIAFGWKLASLGIPTVLVYLGFTGDTGIADVGEPFTSDEHWQTAFHDDVRGVCRQPDRVQQRPLQGSRAPLWILSGSRRVLEVSLRWHSASA